MENPYILFIFSGVLKPDKLERRFKGEISGNFSFYYWTSFEPRGIHKYRTFFKNVRQNILGQTIVDSIPDVNMGYCKGFKSLIFTTPFNQHHPQTVTDALQFRICIKFAICNKQWKYWQTLADVFRNCFPNFFHFQKLKWLYYTNNQQWTWVPTSSERIKRVVQLRRTYWLNSYIYVYLYMIQTDKWQ